MDYKKQLKKFDLTKIANLSILLFLVSFLIAMAVNLFALKRPFLVTSKIWWDCLLTIGLYVVGLVCHESLHGFSAVIFGKCSLKDLKFGFIPKQMMFYCHVKKPLTVLSYKILLIIPMIVTGVIPLIISMAFGNILLVFVFSLLVSGGAGDIIMFKSLLKYENKQLIMDHSEAPAYYLVYAENDLPDNFVEVTQAQEEELLNEMKIRPGEKADGKQKNNLIKILSILIFLGLAVLAVFVIAILMKLI